MREPTPRDFSSKGSPADAPLGAGQIITLSQNGYGRPRKRSKVCPSLSVGFYRWWGLGGGLASIHRSTDFPTRLGQPNSLVLVILLIIVPSHKIVHAA